MTFWNTPPYRTPERMRIKKAPVAEAFHAGVICDVSDVLSGVFCVSSYCASL